MNPFHAKIHSQRLTKLDTQSKQTSALGNELEDGYIENEESEENLYTSDDMDVLTYENMVDSQQIKVQKSCPSFPQLLQNAPLTVSKDDWNRRFQDALADIRSLAPNTRQTERKTVYTRLAHLSEDFVYTAETYGKIIISEVFLPPHCKTIPPLHGQGIAGGDK